MLNESFYKSKYENKEINVRLHKIINVKGLDIKLYKILKPSTDTGAESNYFNFYGSNSYDNEEILYMEQICYLLKNSSIECKIMAIDYAVDTEVMDFLLKLIRDKTKLKEYVDAILEELGVEDLLIAELGNKTEDGRFEKSIFDSIDKFKIYYKVTDI